MPLQTEQELGLYGYAGSLADFRQEVLELKAILCPDWSDEYLLCRPEPEAEEAICAIAFCRELRKRIRCPKMPNSLILHTLINRRKQKLAAERDE